LQINRHRQEKMDVLRGLRGADPYQEFRKGEGLQGLQASVRAAAAAGGGGGGFRATAASVPDVASSLHGSPLVPSMSGGYSFQKSSDIQEVPSWSVSRPKSSSNRDHSSEDDAGFWPAASQQNGSFKPRKVAVTSYHHTSKNFYFFFFFFLLCKEEDMALKEEQEEGSLLQTP
jgi:hypothetical protein